MCSKSFTIQLKHNLVVKIYFYVLHPVYSVKVHKTVLNKPPNKYSNPIISKHQQAPSYTHNSTNISPNLTYISPSSTNIPPSSTSFTNTPAGSTNIPPIVQYHSKFHQFFQCSNKLIPATPPQFHQIPVVKEFSPLIYQLLLVRSSNTR